MRKNLIIGKMYIFIVICFVLLLSGCDEVEIPSESTPTPTPESTDSTIGIAIDSEGFRRWEDTTYGCSCNEYKNPWDPEYSYTGDTGSGFYRIQPEDSLVPLDVYCDMVTENGGWTLVLLNSAYTTPPSPGWLDAIRANNVTGTMLNGIEGGFDQLLGLKYWEDLGDTLRVETGNGPITILHRADYTFHFDEEDHYCIYLSDEVLGAGSTSPGLFTYHNYQPFTTWDSDNDGSTANCSVGCGNTPWWYNSCWSGNFWGGGSSSSSYQNKPYWTGSASDYYNWGAFWIK